MAVQKSTTPKKKAIIAPLTDEKALLERFKDYPAYDVISRRFNNPTDPGTLPILLKGEDPNCCVNSDHQWELKPGATKCHKCKKPVRLWHVRTINTNNDGRFSQVKNKGYLPVDRSELLNQEDLASLVQHPGDNYARLGDHGKEIVMKIPLEIYNHIKGKFLAQINNRATSKAHIQADLAEAAGEELGDQAGQVIHEGGIKLESFKRSRTTLGAEDSED